MERFILTTRRKAGRLVVRLEMRATRNPKLVLDKWEVEVQGGSDRLLMILEVGERSGALVNAERPANLARFDGGRKSFLDLLHEYCGFGFANPDGFPGIGEWGLLHADGMRLALAFALAGRCNSVAKRRALAEGLGSLPAEVVLYWFTLCFYGQRQKAGKAALFTLCNTKG